jgi:formate-dependent nitrite reductase membrane component NrfD
LSESPNPVINSRFFKPQHEWGWQVALYLYLAGMGAGALALGLLMDWLHYSPYPSRAILLWGPVFVGIGAFFLILKLGIKQRFLNTILNPMSSWLSRGFYILSICIVVGGLLLVISLLPFLPVVGINFSIDLTPFAPLIKTMEIIAFIFALSTAVYTGILIQAVRFVSFWHTYLLPALFTVSALSTGAMASVLATSVYDLLAFSEGYSAHMRHVLMSTEQVLLPVEVIVLGLFLYSRYRTTEGQSKSSVRLLMFGKYRLLFWLGIVVCGFVLPPILEAAYNGFHENVFILYAIASFVLISGLCLRIGIVYSGIKDQTPWQKYTELQFYLKYPDAGTIPLEPGSPVSGETR